MNIVVASDEQTPLTDFTVEYLRSQGHHLVLLGDLKAKNGKWVEIAMDAARMCVQKKVDAAVLFCWSGTGATMAANKVKGARAALCSTPQIAQLARKWNDANILVMALVNTTPETAKEILNVWFTTPFDEEGLNQAHLLDDIG